MKFTPLKRILLGIYIFDFFSWIFQIFQTIIRGIVETWAELPAEYWPIKRNSGPEGGTANPRGWTIFLLIENLNLIRAARIRVRAPPLISVINRISKFQKFPEFLHFLENLAIFF
jgi:hypothetical protein